MQVYIGYLIIAVIYLLLAVYGASPALYLSIGGVYVGMYLAHTYKPTGSLP